MASAGFETANLGTRGQHTYLHTNEGAAALLEPSLCPGTAFSCAISLLNLVSHPKEALNSLSQIYEKKKKKRKLGFLCRHGTRH